MVLTEQVQGGVVESQKCTIDFKGKSAAGSGPVLGVKLQLFQRFSLDCLFLSSRPKGEIFSGRTFPVFTRKKNYQKHHTLTYTDTPEP